MTPWIRDCVFNRDYQRQPTKPAKMTTPLIEIRNLQTHFFTDDGVVKAVEDISLTIPKGKTLGLVGESGCGKSVTALSIIRLISNPGKLVGGSITLYDDDDQPTVLSDIRESEMRKFRGNTISMIFQEPMTSLNPVFTIGSQIMEAVLLHQKVSKREAREIAIEMLNKVRIPAPEKRLREYPHQFSGGMRQRVMIAMALACRPRLLIADEPSTALDVTIQAQILDLLRELQAETGMSILIITHDLGVIAELADEVAVMYASKVVERAPVVDLFSNPRHPYTHGLFRSKPKPGAAKDESLYAIDGMVPSPLNFPEGCKFHPRCPHCQDPCRHTEPILEELSTVHFAACPLIDEIHYE